MGDPQELLQCVGFEWDDANSRKIWIKHRVTPFECEQMFFHRPLVVVADVKHSQSENRFYALGRTEAGRLLFTVFTIRRQLIRVISARDMSRKERRVYTVYEKENPQNEE